MLVKNLAEEKSELEKKYNGLVVEVNKMLEDSVRKVQLENYGKLKEEEKNETCDNARIKAEAQLAEMVKENNLLKDELLALKGVQQNEAELKEKLEEEKMILEEEKKTLKEEKRKLEYMLFDLFKAHNLKKEKLKRIEQILHEPEM